MVALSVGGCSEQPHDADTETEQPNDRIVAVQEVESASEELAVQESISENEITPEPSSQDNWRMDIVHLLEGSPTHAEIQALADSLQRKQLQHVEEWLPVIIEALKRDDISTEGIVLRVIDALTRQGNPETAIKIGLEYLQTNQAGKLEEAFDKLIQIDLEEAIALFTEWPPGNSRDKLNVKFASSILQHGTIDDAKAFVATIDSPKVRARAFKEVASSYINRLGRNDEGELEAFIVAEVNGEDAEWAEAVFTEGFHYIGVSMPGFDTVDISALVELAPNEETLAEAIDRLQHPRFIAHHPEVAANMIQLITDDHLRGRLCRDYGSRYLKIDVEATKKWFNTLTNHQDRLDAFSGIATTYSRLDVNEFVAWAREFATDDELMVHVDTVLRRQGFETEADSLSNR